MIYRGLKKTAWKGRFEIICKNPLIILDAAHNPAGVYALRGALFDVKELVGYKNLILIIGILKTKDAKKMLEIIAPACDTIIITKPDTELAMDTAFMYEYLINFKSSGVAVKENVPGAIDYALSKAGETDAICIAGSFFTVGDAVKYFIRSNQLP